MKSSKLIHIVSCHAEGEVGNVIIGGVAPPKGDSLWEKARWIDQDQKLRQFVLNEPRGGVFKHVNLLVPAQNPKAQQGFIIMEPEHTPPMSGSNSICVSTVLLDTGMIQMTEPKTIVTLDTPAGLVRATAMCKNGKCERVSLDMTPSYADQLDVIVEVEGLGEISVDIAFGGIFYALIDPAQFNLKILPENARQLVDIGTRVHRAVNNQLDIKHPELKDLKGISYTMFVGYDDEGVMKGATILPPGRIDRSPCGTGNAARLAVMEARGQVSIAQTLKARSIIDSEFQVEIVAKKTINGRPGILPRISGRGWIHGVHQVGVDPSDPYPLGYKVSDCWGDAFDLLS